MKIAVIDLNFRFIICIFFIKKYKGFIEQRSFWGPLLHLRHKRRHKITSVDLGFIVFNELTYPNLIKFFKELNVNFEKATCLSQFRSNTNIEYGGKGINAIRK